MEYHCPIEMNVPMWKLRTWIQMYRYIDKKILTISLIWYIFNEIVRNILIFKENPQEMQNNKIIMQNNKIEKPREKHSEKLQLTSKSTLTKDQMVAFLK